MAYEEIVAEFIRDVRDRARAEMEAFRQLPSLGEAIRRAALCHWLPDSESSHSEKHPHQYRIPPALLRAAEQRLQNARGAISEAADFDALHRVVEIAIGKKQGLGELAIYDIAHRIGSFLRKEPALVYLHRGTRKGARALGFSGKTLDPAQLPEAFARLTPAEIEDCLCIYEDALRSGQSSARTSQQVSHCIGSDRKRARKC